MSECDIKDCDKDVCDCKPQPPARKRGGIKISEIFLSSQGEGIHVGVPSIFIRTFGCNLTCSGFGMPKGELSKERDKIAENIDSYESFKDIPLAKTGCDSFPSWDPRFKKFSNDFTIDEIVEKIDTLITDKCGEHDFLHIGPGRDVHIVLTGGEPLLAWQKRYLDLFQKIDDKMGGKKWDLTFETNGTQKLHQELIDWFNSHPNLRVTFSVSPKLSESGHTPEQTMKPEAVKTYTQVDNKILYTKFVVGKVEEFDEVESFVDALGHHDHVFIMPVGGCYDEYKEIAPIVATWALERGYRYSPRLHVDLFGNSWGV